MVPVIKPRSRPALSKVLLVGGATRMPAVAHFIRNMTGIEPEQVRTCARVCTCVCDCVIVCVCAWCALLRVHVHMCACVCV